MAPVIIKSAKGKVLLIPYNRDQFLLDVVDEELQQPIEAQVPERPSKYLVDKLSQTTSVFIKDGNKTYLFLYYPDLQEVFDNLGLNLRYTKTEAYAIKDEEELKPLFDLVLKRAGELPKKPKITQVQSSITISTDGPGDFKVFPVNYQDLLGNQASKETPGPPSKFPFRIVRNGLLLYTLEEGRVWFLLGYRELTGRNTPTRISDFGGGSPAYETSGEGLRREVREETGLPLSWLNRKPELCQSFIIYDYEHKTSAETFVRLSSKADLETIQKLIKPNNELLGTIIIDDLFTNTTGLARSLEQIINTIILSGGITF